MFHHSKKATEQCFLFFAELLFFCNPGVHHAWFSLLSLLEKFYTIENEGGGQWFLAALQLDKIVKYDHSNKSF